MSKSYSLKGFTLLEVAIVLAIVGLLLAGGVNLLSGSADTSKYKQTQNELQEVKEALITYFIQNGGVLPCPDIHNDVTNASYGQSDYNSGDATAGGICTNYQGWLPHVTLGMGGGGDAWGERYKYVVSRAFTAPPVTPPNLCGGGFSRSTTNAWRISVYDLLNDATVAPAPPASGSMLGDWAAFALISTGKNGRQANANITATSVGAFQGCNTLNPREQYHCIATTPTTTQPFYLRSGTQMSGGSEIIFDDMVVWVGDYQLISQLRKSGVCDSFGSSTPPPTTTPPSSDPFCDGPAAAAAKRNHGCPGY